MHTPPLRIGYCLSLSGALASNGKTARLAQAITAVGNTDDAALSGYTRKATFETVVGNVTFGEGGSWARPRVLTVQFQNIESNNISEFRRPNTQAVVYPPNTASATMIHPYAKARR